MKNTVLVATVLALCLAGCGGGEQGAPEDQTTPQSEPAPAPEEILGAIVSGEHRTAEETARDAYRHPLETILFFGIEPDMTVVEVSPGGGWYTQILAPYLKSGGGKLYAAGFSRDGASERVLASLDAFERKYVSAPEIYGDIEMTVLGEEIAPEGAADAVVTFRNVHNWQQRGRAAEAFSSFFKALKPGGILGVVEHRADGADLPRDGSSGYAYTDDIVALAEAAGFILDRSSEINANPIDTKEHPFGVWTLPPVRRTSEIRGNEDPEFDQAPYDAIGESDRMTLRFLKPAAVNEALYE